MLSKKDLYHTFPMSLDKYILKNRVLKRADKRIEYAARGTLNGNKGVYHITTKGNKIIHRVFLEVAEWDKGAVKKKLPLYEKLKKVK